MRQNAIMSHHNEKGNSWVLTILNEVQNSNYDLLSNTDYRNIRHISIDKRSIIDIGVKNEKKICCNYGNSFSPSSAF
jgi:hypothetical protein